MLEATLLEDVDRSLEAYREEAFGPLALISKFSTFDAALEEVNDSKFGLQAGIFTRDLFKMFDAWDRLDVGGVVINDVPSYRVDNMPYGGVKDSGLGREGIRFAMEDMTEIRNLVIRRT
jgi:acyl-CoA reductase-like NAD-dependent aldehyde dehydrogenase